MPCAASRIRRRVPVPALSVVQGGVTVPPWTLVLGLCHHCSLPSSVLRPCPTSCRRTCRDCGFCLPRPIHPAQMDTGRISRFSRDKLPHMHRVYDSAGPRQCLRLCALPRIAFPVSSKGRQPEPLNFRSSIPSLCIPLSTLPYVLTERQGKTRGHGGSLRLTVRGLPAADLQRSGHPLLITDFHRRFRRVF